MEYFGDHVMLDGSGGNERRLDHQDGIRSWMRFVALKLKMEELHPPILKKCGPNGRKDPGGRTGFLLIKESHIAIHTFPKIGFATADIYTCKTGVDIEWIKRYFQEEFLFDTVEVHHVKRGTNYPDLSEHYK